MKKSKMKYVIFLVVLLIPIIYSFFYLKSYWDPYQDLTGMKIAVVNLDEAKEENQGTEFVKSLIESDTFEICEVKEDEGKKGMEEGKYYATITVPSNFTQCLNSIETVDKQIASITYSPNQATNYLATQIIGSAMKTIEANLQAKINSKMVKTLADKLNEVPEKIQTIADGAGELSQGSKSLTSGMEQIKQGTSTLNNSYTEFDQGVANAYQGSKTLENGLVQANAGVEKLHTGTQDLSTAITQINNGVEELASKGEEGISSLSTGITQLNQGAGSLNTGVIQYVEGTTQLANGSKNYVNGTQNYVQNVNSYIEAINMVLKNSNLDENTKAIMQEKGQQIKKGGANLVANNETITNGANQLLNTGSTLKGGATTVYEGTQALSRGASGLKGITQGMSSLKQALGQVKTGTSSLQNGVAALMTGTNSLKQGTTSLSSGLATLNSSSTSVKNALNTLEGGTATVYEGSTKLEQGTKQFQDEIQKGIQETNESLKTLEGIEKVAEKPVEIKTESFGEVDSYGVAFTPLFLCIGLWVGALMGYVVLYYDQKNRFGIFDSNAKNKLLQNALYIGVGALEGLITGVLLKIGLGFEVQNIALYYLASVLIGITFTSIIQFLIRNFGDVGKFLALIVLVLQLAAAGGTFPVETIHPSFQSIHPYLPMTYAIKLLREILVPTTANFKGSYLGILVAITVVCLAVTYGVDWLKAKRKQEESKS